MYILNLINLIYLKFILHTRQTDKGFQAIYGIVHFSIQWTELVLESHSPSWLLKLQVSQKLPHRAQNNEAKDMNSSLSKAEERKSIQKRTEV